MATICVKYSGLRFNHIFETTSFVFIPQSKVVNNRLQALSDLMDFFSCIYDENSDFYVILKEPVEDNITIEDFKEERLHKFRFLEAVITLLFSNYLKREYIFILEMESSNYIVKSVFKCLSTNNHKFNRSLLWKNSIYTKFLGKIIEKSFAKFNSISLKEDFATRFAFCVDMYLRGKFDENLLPSFSDLWVSLEVLSDITISRILHSHGNFIVKNFEKQIKKILKWCAFKVPKENIDCWPPIKEEFANHIANKINLHLPIFKKCLTLIKEVGIKVQNIKVPLRKRSAYTDPEDYRAYLDKIKDFKEYQDKLKIKKVLKSVYGNRNALFHEGRVSEDWSIKSDRVKANFIKILEQLYFRILGLTMITYYQMGYPYQYILGIPIKVRRLRNLRWLSRLEPIYVHKTYVEPLHTDYKNLFDFEPVREKYINSPNEFDPLRAVLNSAVEKILNYLNGSHPTQILSDDLSLDYILDYHLINKKKVDLTFGRDMGIYSIVYDRKPRVIIKSQDNANISSTFIGMFDDDIRDNVGTIKVPFRINPPYIFLSLN